MDKQALIDKLFSVGAHFGYAPSRRHPSVAPFIFGTKGGSEIIDLEATSTKLMEALEVVKSLAQGRKTILFVGSKAEAREALKRAADRLAQPYVASRWIGARVDSRTLNRRVLAKGLISFSIDHLKLDGVVGDLGDLALPVIRF
jgi:small subunit ribosomal protein S2